MNGTHQFLSSSFFFPSNQRKTRKLLCKLNWAHVPVTNSHVRPATCQHKVIFVLLNYSQCKLMRCLGLSCFHKRNSQIICVICFGDFFFLLISWRWWIFVIYWTTGSCARELFCSFKWTPASFITIIWKKTLVSLVWFVYYECSLTIKLFIPVRRNVANASMFVLFNFFL